MPRIDRNSYNEYMRESILARYHERRISALNLLGALCHSCYTEEKLEFDHIDRDTKNFAISKLWSISWDKFIEELEKCQILCHDCHKEKTKQYRDYRKAIR